jgi:hypothetical protein
MITFPEEFIETSVPGYFWSIKEQKLYSIKSGQLKILSGPVKIETQYKGRFFGWVVSHMGERVYLAVEYLTSLNDKNADYELPVIRERFPSKKKQTGEYYQTRRKSRSYADYENRYNETRHYR